MHDLTWIDDVLADLEKFTEINDLPRMREMLSDTRMVVTEEIEARRKRSLHFRSKMKSKVNLIS